MQQQDRRVGTGRWQRRRQAAAVGAGLFLAPPLAIPGNPEQVCHSNQGPHLALLHLRRVDGPNAGSSDCCHGPEEDRGSRRHCCCCCLQREGMTKAPRRCIAAARRREGATSPNWHPAIAAAHNLFPASFQPGQAPGHCSASASAGFDGMATRRSRAPQATEGEGPWVRQPADTKPAFTVGTLRKAVPAHCFQRSLLRSAAYLAADLLLLAALVAASSFIDAAPLPAAARWLVLWPAYWFFAGAVATGLWVSAHGCIVSAAAAVVAAGGRREASGLAAQSLSQQPFLLQLCRNLHFQTSMLFFLYTPPRPPTLSTRPAHPTHCTLTPRHPCPPTAGHCP